MEAVNSVLQSDAKNMTKMAALLCCYGFDLGGLSALDYIDNWLASYSKYWIRLAIVEALYQGRYKAISVDHILRLWKRRGQPTFHFTHEFERMICRHLILNPEMQDKIQSHPTTAIAQEVPIIDQPDQDETSQRMTEPSVEEVPRIFQNIPFTIDSVPDIGDSALPMSEEIELDTNYHAQDRSENLNSERSIHQFIPHADSSQLYSKLRAVIHQELAQRT